MILRIDCYLMIYLLLRIKEWTLEDIWDIKRVMESQGDMHNKVEVQANLESRSLTSSPTRSTGSTCLQINVQDAFDL
jgi:hypothetical protein